jgi:steroid 5-alpha reductase family enzyme
VGALFFGDFSARALVVVAFTAVWSLRLGAHLARRTRGKSDDPRYAALIAEWGEHAPRRMFWFLQYQAWAGVPLVLSIVLAALNPQPLWRLLDVLAVGVMVIALSGEAAADYQLQRFRTDARNRDRVCDAGLWRYSRHPNYFFEFLSWCAYPLFAVSINEPWSWLALAAPATMYWLLVHVSGIPPLEEHMLRTRGDDFRDYQRRTNAFFPWFPT